MLPQRIEDIVEGMSEAERRQFVRDYEAYEKAGGVIGDSVLRATVETYSATYGVAHRFHMLADTFASAVFRYYANKIRAQEGW